MEGIASRLKTMTEELASNPDAYNEWSVTKNVFAEERDGDITLEENGEMMNNEEMRKLRNAMVRLIARRSGYFLNDKNLIRTLLNNEQTNELSPLSEAFHLERTKRKNGTGSSKLWTDYRVKEVELAKKWKEHNRYYIWVLIWNMFALVTESKLNKLSPKNFHHFLLIEGDLNIVANALWDHFQKFPNSGFHNKKPWDLSVKGVLLNSLAEIELKHKGYQEDWGLLAFSLTPFESELVKDIKAEDMGADGLMSLLEDLMERIEKGESDSEVENTLKSSGPIQLAKEGTPKTRRQIPRDTKSTTQGKGMK